MSLDKCSIEIPYITMSLRWKDVPEDLQKYYTSLHDIESCPGDVSGIFTHGVNLNMLCDNIREPFKTENNDKRVKCTVIRHPFSLACSRTHGAVLIEPSISCPGLLNTTPNCSRLLDLSPSVR